MLFDDKYPNANDQFEFGFEGSFIIKFKQSKTKC